MEVQYSSRFPSDHYPSGKIETYSFHSTILNDTRKIYIYTPHDYSHTSHLQELLIVFDGNSFINNLSIARTLNYLIYEKEIPSCIAVAIEPVDRLEELTYNDKMNTFLTEELLPWIQARYHVYQEKNHTTIAGFSLGGLAAFTQRFKIHMFSETCCQCLDPCIGKRMVMKIKFLGLKIKFHL